MRHFQKAGRHVSTMNFFVLISFFTLPVTMATAGKERNSTAKIDKILVCYYLPRTDLLNVTDIDPQLCTHLVYAFAKIDHDKLIENSLSDTKRYKEMTNLKSQNPKLKVLLSVQQGFPALVNSSTKVYEKFYKQAMSFLKKHEFDGIDLDWEFPPAEAKQNYSNFLLGFRKAITKESQASRRTALSLSAALPNTKSKINNYDMSVLAKTLDFATAMTYDLHMFIKNIDTITGFNSALFPPKHESRFYSVDGLIEYYLKEGFPPSKLLVGIPTYGRTYKLANAEKHGIHAPAVDRGDGGPILHKKGVYSYTEALYALKKGATRVWDSTSDVPYLYKGTFWCSYEDAESAEKKAKYFLKTLGGAGVWTLTLDTTTVWPRFQIINAIKKVFQDSAQP